MYLDSLQEQGVRGYSRSSSVSSAAGAFNMAFSPSVVQPEGFNNSKQRAVPVRCVLG